MLFFFYCFCVHILVSLVVFLLEIKLLLLLCYVVILRIHKKKQNRPSHQRTLPLPSISWDIAIYRCPSRENLLPWFYLPKYPKWVLIKIWNDNRHDDVMIWEYFRHCWPYVMRINQCISTNAQSVMWRFGVFHIDSLNKLLNKRTCCRWFETPLLHCNVFNMVISDRITVMSQNVKASQITGKSNVCLIVCSGWHQRNPEGPPLLALCEGNHRWPVVSPHKEPVMRKAFPFNNVIMRLSKAYMAR